MHPTMSMPAEQPREATPPTANKRKGPRGRASYPRKRALIACETCRTRKTKCDNQRPTCGGCADLEIGCNYQTAASDFSTYDRASLEILDRINYVAGLLENQRAGGWPEVPPHPDVSPQDSTGMVIGRNDTETANDEFLESLEITGRGPGICEDILEWPIFGLDFDRSRTESLIFRSSRTLEAENALNFRSGRGINEEDAPVLVERFLINVHIKNPVLDPDDVRRKARHIAEAGYTWDADSCLLLTISALSAISSDFTPEPVTPELVAGPNAHISLTDAGDYGLAEAYYAAARKRLGLLDYTIPAAQCYFLMGVYEMYSLRPVKAWGSFKRACDILQVYFRGPQVHDHSEGVVSRLYWSCLKSECEIRMEISLPPSGLAKATYSDMFPTPPSEEPDSPFSGYRQNALEQVWSYYLSEIAVRRIGNRIVNCFYQEDATAWLSTPLHRIARIAEELDLQLTQWFDNLPPILSAPITEEASPDPQERAAEELRFVLRARLSDFREKIYRPFLYLAVHLPSTDPSQQALGPYVQRCVDACMVSLLRGIPRHRHHGTWYENRGVFLKTLLMVAVAKSGRSELPEDWREGADLCRAGFMFWEAESSDLQIARGILDQLLSDV